MSARTPSNQRGRRTATQPDELGLVLPELMKLELDPQHTKPAVKQRPSTTTNLVADTTPLGKTYTSTWQFPIVTFESIQANLGDWVCVGHRGCSGQGTAGTWAKDVEYGKPSSTLPIAGHVWPCPPFRLLQCGHRLAMLRRLVLWRDVSRQFSDHRRGKLNGTKAVISKMKKRRRTKSYGTIMKLHNMLRQTTGWLGLNDLHYEGTEDGDWDDPYTWLYSSIATDAGPDMICAYHFLAYGPKKANIDLPSREGRVGVGWGGGGGGWG